ncbi:hypothetical protein ABXT08_19320 [Chryseobacterium sp. NRRL B-14859]|uniref:hypothetical protein n=1 Tax=Chryseobacterium sp. NRRL B-14859 TaxID=1562763 RepID=UPI00339946DD
MIKVPKRIVTGIKKTEKLNTADFYMQNIKPVENLDFLAPYNLAQYIIPLCALAFPNKYQDYRIRGYTLYRQFPIFYQLSLSY